jgi:hypothetical protein
MSAFAMHPTFKDINGYRAWRSQWRGLYRRLSREIANDRRSMKALACQGSPEASEAQRDLHHKRVMASKMMTLLDDAKGRWKRILAMEAQIAEQMASFPLVIENCSTVDFHFNKGSIEFPFLPMWTVKAKGKSYYLHHVDFDCVGTTRETPDHPSTKGAIRFRNITLHISADGTARFSRREEQVARAA